MAFAHVVEILLPGHSSLANIDHSVARDPGSLEDSLTGIRRRVRIGGRGRTLDKLSHYRCAGYMVGYVDPPADGLRRR